MPSTLPTPLEPFPRSFYKTLKTRLSSFCPLIQILTGPRQIGKTTAIKKITEELDNVSATYITLDNPGPNPHERIRFEWNKVVGKQGLKLIIFDEIQNVPDWAPLIKELFDAERPKRQTNVVILGSSALELLLRGEESLLGRFEIVHTTHWNAYEMQKAFAWDLQQFLEFGGYPILSDLYDKNNLARCQDFVRDAIIEPVITRDIFTLQSVVNSALFRQVMRIALSLPCEEISFTKLLGQLSEKGSSATVKNYLELMEKAFLIKLLYRYSRGVVAQRTSSPKIIPLAPALIHAYKDPQLLNTDPSWLGHIYESAVISRLLSTGYDAYYWSNSREDVDLVLDTGASVYAIEIKYGHGYDFRGLKAFKQKYPDAKTLLVTRELGDRLLLCEDMKSFFENDLSQ